VILVDEVMVEVNVYDPLRVRVEVVLFYAKFSLRVYVGVLIVMRAEELSSLIPVMIPTFIFLYRWK